MNVEVSNHMQALEDDQIKTLDKKFRQQESNNNTKQNTQNNHQKQQNNNNNKNNNKQSNKGNANQKAIIITKIMPKIIKITKTIRTIKIIKTTKVTKITNRQLNQKKCLLKSHMRKALQLAS